MRCPWAGLPHPGGSSCGWGGEEIGGKTSLCAQLPPSLPQFAAGKCSNVFYPEVTLQRVLKTAEIFLAVVL